MHFAEPRSENFKIRRYEILNLALNLQLAKFQSTNLRGAEF